MRPLTLLTAATLALLACGGDDDGSNGPNPPAEGDIILNSSSFDPSTFNATAGQTVTWAWAATPLTHNIVFEDGAPGSGNKSSGTFERTFATAGSYPYHCSIHGAPGVGMNGVVNVAAGGSGDSGGGGTGGGGGNPGDSPY
jgi:plastocyanin